jgi:hypothetical protein
MLPKQHIILGGIFAISLYLIFQLTIIQVTIIFLASFLIDVDHYVHYVLRKKDLSLKNSYNWFMELVEKERTMSKSELKKANIPVCFFHGVESFAIILILAIYFPLFWMIFIGFAFHRVLDDIYPLYTPARHHHISSIYGYFTTKKLKHLEDL